MQYIGRHVSIAGSMDIAFDRAAALGCTAMQIFVTNPRGWAFANIEPEVAERFREKGLKTGIRAVAHMPYLPNIASSNQEIYGKSVESLTLNLKRCDSLGIPYLVTHMGSHMGHGKQKGRDNIIEAVGRALGSDHKAMILLENEAGHNNSIGDELADMQKVYDAVGDRKLGFCLDTCHLFAAGYDITKHDALDRMFGEVDKERVFAIHLNDAMMELGSHRDRHANIGFGHIGKEGFRSFLSYPGISSKTILLETPVGEEISEADEIALVKGILSRS